MGDAVDILEAVVNEVDAGRRVALCAIVATRGSTPQPAGVFVCVDEAANMIGTLGGGCVEADLRRRAHTLLSNGHSELVTVTLDHDFGYDDGMICGGQMDVAIQVLSDPRDTRPHREAVELLRNAKAAAIPMCVTTDTGLVGYRINVESAPRLLIAGAGHIARVIAGLAVPLGFDVHVIDDRADYANPQRFPPPVHTTAGPIDTTLEQLAPDGSTYVVIVTRGHKHDEKALQAVLDSPTKYIGMIGSRRKIAVTFDDLKHAGATDEQLARVHAPIGLSIGAVTTEEIAVSIVAELISVRRTDRRKIVEGPTPISDDAP